MVHLHRPGCRRVHALHLPEIKPAIEPQNTATITAAVSNGRVVAGMPNYWLGATGRYYFPGLYTAILPMIPGIAAIRRVLRARNT